MTVEEMRPEEHCELISRHAREPYVPRTKICVDDWLSRRKLSLSCFEEVVQGKSR